MKLAYLPPYGHACCPHCKTEFDLAAAEPTFRESVPCNNDTAIFMMCPECHVAYQKADESIRVSMTDTCFANVRPTEIPSRHHPWAITTMLTMELNDFDPVAAIENGHGLTRELYLGVWAGTYDFVALSGGVRIVAAKPTTSGAV